MESINARGPSSLGTPRNFNTTLCVEPDEARARAKGGWRDECTILEVLADAFDSKEALFNPHCRTLHLLQSIKRRCGCPDGVKVDLSDVNGVVKNLTDHEASPANTLLNERETFILVRVERNEENPNPVYTPLLHNDDLVTTEFLESLRRTPTDTLEVSGRQSRHSTRRSSLKTTGKSKLSGNLNFPVAGATGPKSPTGKRRGSVFKQKGS